MRAGIWWSKNRREKSLRRAKYFALASEYVIKYSCITNSSKFWIHCGHLDFPWFSCSDTSIKNLKSEMLVECSLKLNNKGCMETQGNHREKNKGKVVNGVQSSSDWFQVQTDITLWLSNAFAIFMVFHSAADIPSATPCISNLSVVQSRVGMVIKSISPHGITNIKMVYLFARNQSLESWSLPGIRHQ